MTVHIEDIAAPTVEEVSPGEVEGVNYEEIISTLNTLQANGVTSQEKRITVGRRIANLVLHSSMSESVAAKRAVDELFECPYAEKGRLLGVSDSAVSKASQEAFSGGTPSLFNFHNFNGPTNIIFNETVSEKYSEADVKYILMKLIDRREEETKFRTTTGGSRPQPNIKSIPPEPKYALVELPVATSYSVAYKSRDPCDRNHHIGTGDLTISWFFSDDEVVDYLYTERRFVTLSHAEVWQEILSNVGFNADADPFTCLNNDAQREMLRDDD